MSQLREIILESLQNAKENGETFEGWTNKEIALDMCNYDADVCNYVVKGGLQVDPKRFKEVLSIIGELRSQVFDNPQ